MVPSNILQRTFHIKYGQAIGTCFTIDVDNKQYLVTARHVVDGVSNSDTIDIFNDDKWHSLNCSLVGNAKADADISVLALDIQLSPTHPLPVTGHFYLSQDAYFIGYPYGMFGNVGKTNSDFPVPFVKKGIISSFGDDPDGIYIIYLDGHNNPGFSGGPVVCQILGTQDCMVIGVISGFRFEEEPIFIGDNQTNLAYKYNTGIIVSVHIKHALEIIETNPIGFDLNKIS